MIRSRAKGSRLFFRRHNRLLTFTGALIVFVTFLVKEGKRESLKDLGDSVDAAESVFVIQSDSLSYPLLLTSMEDKINSIVVASHLEPREKIVLLFPHPWAQMKGDAMVTRASKVLDNASRLFEKLPHRSELIGERLHALNDLVAKDEPSWSEELGVTRFSTLGTSKVGDLNDLWMLDKQADALANEILLDAEEIRASAERSYATYTWASYGLYTLGWCLGLLGKLYGAAEDSE
jgi:hypothetical protein